MSLLTDRYLLQTDLPVSLTHVGGYLTAKQYL